jgi:uncharacterized protein (DUF2126 family)
MHIPPPSYRTGEWKKIQSCSRLVEKLIQQSGQVLTMGGEPTFVPFSPNGEEWSTAALGPTKLLCARRFAQAFVQLYYPGALVTQSYGKQYPGEVLPRWNLVIHIHPERKLWTKPKRLLLGPGLPHSALASPKKVISAIAKELNLNGFLHAASEHATTSEIKGWVLPLAHENGKWASDKWKLPPHRHIPLIPGDSSIGLRLPLNELPEKTLKRALTVEIKEGGLEIFFPPLDPKPYLQLIRIVEKLADSMDLQGLILSGYQPKEDAGLERFVLASDPGVIEVNLPPCRDWKIYHQQMEQLYTAAHQAGLCGHKLHFNGRMVGTGGGAHVCFGGTKPHLSPVFHVPNFLPAVITYWQNHPALSYVFSGQFVGQGSQAPRIDETMPGTLRELEMAFPGVHVFKNNPELFAMLFRDLLSDCSGNTHRAEISIDKLWNTQHPNTMAGILEFRAFEAFPDPKAMAMIGLFLRSILAMLLLKPKIRPMQPWGDSLHDRFFLPSRLWKDLEDICKDLQQAGIPWQAEWMRPIFEFRFPLIGAFSWQQKKISFRHALEAWPLLSEQPIGGSTARFVDSSTERLEVTLSSASLAKDGLLLVNGIPVPFSSDKGSGHAGIRFRAFHVIPSLHPHIPTQTPLLFQWVNRKSGKVEQAAEWNTWLPAGQNYPGRPQSLKEAAQRFHGRWKNRADLLGKTVKIPSLNTSSDRWTTDLRLHC